MNEQDAFEQAFMNGYEKGKADAAAEIFAEIGKILHRWGELAERDNSDYGELVELILGDIIASIAELKNLHLNKTKEDGTNAT